MKQAPVLLLLVASFCTHIVPAKASDVGVCFRPEDPFPDKLAKSDPLYQTALEEHQQQLEDLESYVNCLDRERGAAFGDLGSSFDLFLENFGEDAVLKYAKKKQNQ